MQKIKVGIIGVGLMGPIHIEALRRLGFVEVVALCDSNQKRVEEEAKKLKREDYVEKEVKTEDYASLLLRFNNGARGVFTTSQLCPGRKCRIFYEIDGSKCAVSWNHEEANQLWIGHRNKANEVLLRDPTLIYEEARAYAHYPGGHNEGWPDDIKNIFSNMYQFIREEKDVFKDKPNFPTFVDGHNIMLLVEAVLKSNREQRWIEIEEF